MFAYLVSNNVLLFSTIKLNESSENQILFKKVVMKSKI